MDLNDLVEPLPKNYRGKHVVVTPVRVEGGYSALIRISDDYSDPSFVPARVLLGETFQTAIEARTAGADAAEVMVDEMLDRQD